MSVITEFTIPADTFALEYTFNTVPDTKIEIERLATHSREWIMPFLWAINDDLDAVKTAFENDPCIDEFQLLDTKATTGYFNVHWTEDVQQLVDQIVDQHGIMQEAEAVNGTWYLKLQFVDQNALKEFQTYFHKQGYSFELQRMHTGIASKEREYDLTPEQREALVTALEMGYFSIPRETQIEDLAEELDISTNAVSERLRRATGNLSRNLLTVSLPNRVSDAE